MDFGMQRKLVVVAVAVTGACLGAGNAVAAETAATHEPASSATAPQGKATPVHGARTGHATQTSDTGGARAVGNAGSDTATDLLFERLDANHDGRLTRAELQHDRHLATQAHSLDRNHDGALSRDELAAYHLGAR